MKKEIKTIGIIGMGSVGTSIAYLLQKANLNIIAFKPKAKTYRQLMQDGKIKIINKTTPNAPSSTGQLNINITDSLLELVNHSDLILNCCLFPQSSDTYHFNPYQKAILKKKNTPILAFPGTLGSTWFIGLGKIEVGLIGYSPVFSTKENTLPSSAGLTIKLLDFKSRIPLAHDDPNTRLYLLDFFNKHLKFKDKVPTFIDGGSCLQTALSSPISTINAAAICNKAQQLIDSNGQAIKGAIYALEEEYSQLFQNAFQEQLNVANALDLFNLPTIKDWLSNRKNNLQSNCVTDMLHQTYKNKIIAISGTDRRITESYYALLFFKTFAQTLGIQVPATEILITQIKQLQQALSKSYAFQDIDLALQNAALHYAKNILSKREIGELVI
ncbi:NAD(P)-binding domain-containing protein [Aureispira anguillae]|uniref:NAD(P)-binding domain-containing protein n=1 Tax=Aureispira anguillae TaxID=2864201 RepID=A0A915YFD1_9BACT|nr:NAD(P)-binding domain-containing protein [Aureispira anguillae]BDS11973.1 NAD(P)-binding domain-containing protein [Aureispira anguillae]